MLGETGQPMPWSVPASVAVLDATPGRPRHQLMHYSAAASDFAVHYRLSRALHDLNALAYLQRAVGTATGSLPAFLLLLMKSPLAAAEGLLVLSARAREAQLRQCCGLVSLLLAVAGKTSPQPRHLNQFLRSFLATWAFTSSWHSLHATPAAGNVTMEG